MTYEELLIQNDHLHIKEMDLSGVNGLKGLCINENIAIEKSLCNAEKACILAEELGHYYTSYGNIIDQDNANNRKQELIARTWAYDKQIGLIGLISAYKHGCQNIYETAEFLGVTEKFLEDAIERYRNKYGAYACVDNYIIYFIPNLAVCEIL